MSFDADWLALRAPADAAARDAGLRRRAAALLGAAAAPLAVDLGAGTGATVRAFADIGPPGLRWRLVDQDRDLLARARALCGSAVATMAADLGEIDALPLAGASLVTASALLDLMPRWWLDALAARLAAQALPVYAALTYDGTMAWTPARADDAEVTALFNEHQRGDKGLGPALGPLAPEAFANALRSHGYRVSTASSPWRLGAGSAALQVELVDGIVAAAGPECEAWGQARRAASGSALCTVGHVDLLALPRGLSAQSNTTSDASP